MSSSKLLVTKKEAARLLSVSRNRIKDFVDCKMLTPVMLPGQKRELIAVSDLQTFIEDRKI